MGMAPQPFSVSVQVAAPPGAVWSVWDDLAGWPSWTSSVTSVQPSEPGTLAVGTTARIEQPSMPKLTWRVSEVVPGECFVWSSTILGVTTTARHVVRPTSAGSEVELTMEQSGLLAPLFALLAGKRGRRYVETEAAGVKAAAEAAAGSA